MPHRLFVNEAPSPSVAAAVTPAVENRHWTILLGAGLVLALIGWIDIALLWYPLQLTNLEWEFSTVTAAINALPLATMGMTLAAVAAVARRSRAVAQVLGTFSLLVIFVVVGWSVLYGLTLTAGYGAVDPAIRPLFVRAVAKTSVLVVVYALFYSWLGWMLFRSGRAKDNTL
jgi:hypothetical protein